tara:strand:- start:74 stop:580 length:507 start_codon:yes stop_codon:yes gene_type:complete
MFTFYKKHNNTLYNKLVQLSRNKFFYQELRLPDNFETRVLLIFFHLVIIFKTKKNTKYKKDLQNLFDNVFQNIEINIRELGYGDTKVNKTMKNLSKIFYDILTNLDKKIFFSFNSERILLEKYFYNSKKIEDDQNVSKLADYFEKFQNFCFDLDVNNMLNGSIEFKYR